MKMMRIARAGLVASLMAAALTTAAQAQEGMMVKNFLGAIGVIPEDKDPIEYRERAPLVLPPRMELRDPAEPGSAQARNPQWPNDPDAAAKRRRAIEDSKPITETDQRRTLTGSARLSIEEMRAGRRAGAQIPTAPVSRSDNNHWEHPDVLRAQGRQGRSTEVAGGENVRRTLTEPPSAYRQSATGQPIKGTFDVPERVDESDPRAFQRQMQQRR